MKIAFEKWLDENEIPDEAITLFEESIRCYKISAYRSAFIMSYIAFQNILKTRMIKATNTPTGIPTTWWTNICRELGDDDKHTQGHHKLTEVSDLIRKESKCNRIGKISGNGSGNRSTRSRDRQSFGYTCPHEPAFRAGNVPAQGLR